MREWGQSNLLFRIPPLDNSHAKVKIIDTGMDIHSINSLKIRPCAPVHSLSNLEASGDTVSKQIIALSIGTLGATFSNMGIWSEVAKTMERCAWSILKEENQCMHEAGEIKMIHVF